MISYNVLSVEDKEGGKLLKVQGVLGSGSELEFGSAESWQALEVSQEPQGLLDSVFCRKGAEFWLTESRSPLPDAALAGGEGLPISKHPEAPEGGRVWSGRLGIGVGSQR